jgi:predicted GNAT superfamily acetyltransferase
MDTPALQFLTPPETALGTPLGAALLALNNSHAAELSLLAPDQLAHLVGQAYRAWRVGEVDAFLLALDETAAYDSPNFRWFRDRFPRFVYVDRIVVARTARGRGLARMLYDELIRQATQAGHARIVCEVNISPPNPTSDAFHAALGFAEVGSASIHDGAKTVRYLEHRLT